MGKPYERLSDAAYLRGMRRADAIDEARDRLDSLWHAPGWMDEDRADDVAMSAWDKTPDVLHDLLRDCGMED